MIIRLILILLVMYMIWKIGIKLWDILKLKYVVDGMKLSYINIIRFNDCEVCVLGKMILVRNRKIDSSEKVIEISL